ncbi:MAG TPA: hypothetical protein DIT32_07740 [Peptococcaceae bacterium]|nr:hypothetical protein [Peptococcaceae bacterium]
MITVIVPFCILLAIILIKKIPYIGGNIQVALLITGLTALLMGGIYNPISWLTAWVNGIDRIAWVMALTIFGSIYAETQVKMGTMDTVLNVMRAWFGHSPKGLITVIIFSLCLAGSLLGDAVAASTVIGVLIIKSLDEMGLSGEHIACTIVMGASLGSIMPPVTQSIFLAASLVGIDPTPVTNLGYITVGIGIVICCLYVAFTFVKIKSLPEDLIPKQKAGAILKENWKVLIPLMVLVFIILLRLIFKIDVITLAFGPILTVLKDIKILKGLTNLIVASLIVVTIISCLYPKVRNELGGTLWTGIKNVKGSIYIQGSAGLMLGAFYAAGQIEAVKNFAMGLNANLLKIGGAASLNLIGMLTGSQSTAQNSIFAFFGPALVELGIDPVHAAIAGSHIAASGQGMPPADLTCFVVCGLVGGILGKKVDPLKTMILNLPMCLYLFAVGFLFMFI